MLSALKIANVIDEIPMAYKDIDAVMAAQNKLVEIVHQLRQVVCERVSFFLPFYLKFYVVDCRI